MMARSLKAPSIGRIQKRKTNLLQIIIFGLQRVAGPYKWAMNRHRLPWRWLGVSVKLPIPERVFVLV